MSNRYFLLSFVAVAMLMIVAPAWAQAPAGGPRVTVDVESEPLSTCLAQMMQGRASYVLEEAVSGVRVTAHLTDVDVESALRAVIGSASNVAYRKDENGIYVITSDLEASGNRRTTYTNGYYPGSRTESIRPVRVDPAVIMKALPQHVDGVEYVQNANGLIVVRGLDGGIADVKHTISVIDAPKASLQSVRVTINAEFTATPKVGRPKVYRAGTSAVGFADEQMPLNLTVGSVKSEYMNLVLNLVPALVNAGDTPNEDPTSRGQVTLTGNGSIHTRLPMELNENIPVGVSIPASGRVVIASGSAEFPTGQVQYKVTASATTDKSSADSPKMSVKRAKLVPPDHQPITDYAVLIGATDDRPFIDNWNAPERSIFWQGLDPMRWSRFGSKLKLPVKPGKKYVLTFEAHVPNAGLRPGSGVFLGDQKICGIDKTGNIKVKGTIPPQKASPIVLTVECANWRPTDFMGADWSDRRELGVAVRV